MTRRRFTDEQEREICRRYEAGEDGIELAEALGCSRGLIYKILNKHNVKMRAHSEIMKGRSNRKNPKITDELELEICRRYLAGESAPQLAESLGFSRDEIYGVLVRRNVRRRIVSEATKKRFEDPQERQKTSAGLKKYHAENPEAGRIHGEKMRQYRADPEVRQRMSEIMKNHYAENPEAGRIHGEKMRQYFADPEARQRQSAALKKYYVENPESRIVATNRLAKTGDPDRRGDVYRFDLHPFFYFGIRRPADNHDDRYTWGYDYNLPLSFLLAFHGYPEPEILHRDIERAPVVEANIIEQHRDDPYCLNIGGRAEYQEDTEAAFWVWLALLEGEEKDRAYELFEEFMARSRVPLDHYWAHNARPGLNISIQPKGLIFGN